LEQEEPKQPMHAIWAGKSLWQLGDVLRAAQREAEAKQVLDEALRVFEQATARCPEASELRQEQAFSHRKIGVFYESAGKSEEAEAQFRSAIAVYAALKKEFPTNTFYAQEEAYTTWTLAKVLGRAGRSDAAEAAYRQAVSLHEKAIADSPNQPELKVRLRAIRLGLATLLDMQGKTAQAEALHLREPQDAASPASPPEASRSSERALDDILAAEKAAGRTATPPPSSSAVSPRPENATPEMVDLTRHYNAALTSRRPGDEGYDLAHLPSGIQTFQGVRFDVRGIVQLSGGATTNTGAKAGLQRVQGIQIGRKCTRLHFLHSTGWAVSNGTVVGWYVLRYADGSSQTLPIVYGQDVRDWWVGMPEELGIRNGRVAWEGKTSSGHPVRIYSRTWENPSPDVEVASIEFTSAMTKCAPFLLAITTE
jgi:tetratricopeptide (TPR) repeat protein